MRTPLRLGGLLGFVGGFLFAYQRSSRTSAFPFLKNMGVINWAALDLFQSDSGAGRRTSVKTNWTEKKWRPGSPKVFLSMADQTNPSGSRVLHTEILRSRSSNSVRGFLVYAILKYTYRAHCRSFPYVRHY